MTFREQIAKLRDKLSDATAQITAMTEEFTSLKSNYDEQLGEFWFFDRKSINVFFFVEGTAAIGEENQELGDKLQRAIEEKDKRNKEYEKLVVACKEKIRQYEVSTAY